MIRSIPALLIMMMMWQILEAGKLFFFFLIIFFYQVNTVCWNHSTYVFFSCIHLSYSTLYSIMCTFFLLYRHLSFKSRVVITLAYWLHSVGMLGTSSGRSSYNNLRLAFQKEEIICFKIIVTYCTVCGVLLHFYFAYGGFYFSWIHEMIGRFGQ